MPAGAVIRQSPGAGEQAAEGGVQTAAGSMEPLMQKEWRPKFAQTVMEILGPVGQLGAGSRFAPLGGWPEKHYCALAIRIQFSSCSSFLWVEWTSS